jgi:hypothetical protein
MKLCKKEEGDKGGVCSILGKEEKWIDNKRLVEKPDHLEDTNIARRIILKFIVNMRHSERRGRIRKKIYSLSKT